MGWCAKNNIGEGNYAETEENIQKLLNERNQTLGLTMPIPTGLVNVTGIDIQTGSPETYFGYARNEYLGNGKQQTPGMQTLTAPALSSAQPNTLYLGGTWNFQSEYAETVSANTTIIYHYKAKDVYLVASSQKNVTLLCW